jgi:hypothetical protein
VMIRLINVLLWIPYMISFDSFDAKIIFIWKISIGNILRGYSFEIQSKTAIWVLATFHVIVVAKKQFIIEEDKDKNTGH